MSDLQPSSYDLEQYLPKNIRAKYHDLPQDIAEKSEYFLKNYLASSTEGIGKSFKTLEILKAHVWSVYRDKASSGQKPQVLAIPDLIHGICTFSWFNRYVLSNSYAIAYLFSPPPHEFGRMQVIINKSLERLDEVLALPLMTYDSKGNEKVNTPLIAQIHGIMKTMMERVHGGVIQRAQIHTHTTGGKDAGASVALPNMAQLEEMSKQLERLEKIAGKEAIEAQVVEGNDTETT